jgi:hypothetical protein
MGASTVAVTAPRPLNGGLRKLIGWGTGVGIQIEGADLHAVVCRLRPGGASVAGAARISNVAERPSAEWGAELGAFLRKHSAAHVGAVLLLPRGGVTVRTLALPGVAGGDLASAVSLQVDTLHPYDETDAVFSWAQLPESGQLLVGVAQASAVSIWSARFAEAGVKLASVSFSAAALYTAARFYRTPPAEFLAAAPAGTGGGELWELYGESEARPVFSSPFDSTERTLAMARADLRLDAASDLLGVERILPPPVQAPEGFDIRPAALPYAAALASAAPRWALTGNLLPEAQRANGSAWTYVPTMVLATLLTIGVGLLAAQDAFQNQRYLKRLNAEIVKMEKQAQRAQAIDAQAALARDQVGQLDGFRTRSAADANALKEITALVAPPAWVTNLTMNRSEVSFNGESPEPAALVQVLDQSPMFVNSGLGQMSGQLFAIHMNREGRGTTALKPEGAK